MPTVLPVLGVTGSRTIVSSPSYAVAPGGTRNLPLPVWPAPELCDDYQLPHLTSNKPRFSPAVTDSPWGPSWLTHSASGPPLAPPGRSLASAAHRRHQLQGDLVERVHDDVGEGKCILGWRKGRIGHGEYPQSGCRGRP